MADLGLLKTDFEDFECSLREASCDEENKQYLCSSPHPVYCFDKYMKTLYPSSTPCSFDVLHFPSAYKNLIICIEFKNQILSDIEMSDVYKKYEDGFKELEELFKKNKLSIKDYCFEFFLVCKNSVSGRTISRDKLNRNDNKESDLKKWVKAHENKMIRKSTPQIKRIQECVAYYKAFFSSSCSK